MNYDQFETLNTTLKFIEGALGRIATALEEANKSKPIGLGNPYLTHSTLNAVSKDENPFPTPWNNPSSPTCKGDSLTNELYS
jgi:hypothetical protein